jgi:hypothetical protein
MIPKAIYMITNLHHYVNTNSKQGVNICFCKCKNHNFVYTFAICCLAAC